MVALTDVVSDGSHGRSANEFMVALGNLFDYSCDFGIKIESSTMIPEQIGKGIFGWEMVKDVFFYALAENCFLSNLDKEMYLRRIAGIDESLFYIIDEYYDEGVRNSAEWCAHMYDRSLRGRLN